jgi:hypothetical protein
VYCCIWFIKLLIHKIYIYIYITKDILGIIVMAYIYIYIWGVIIALFVHNNGTLGWDPMCGPHPNVPWCCVIVVHCECFDHFPIYLTETESP